MRRQYLPVVTQAEVLGRSHHLHPLQVVYQSMSVVLDFHGVLGNTVTSIPFCAFCPLLTGTGGSWFTPCSGSAPGQALSSPGLPYHKSSKFNSGRLGHAGRRPIHGPGTSSGSPVSLAWAENPKVGLSTPVGSPLTGRACGRGRSQCCFVTSGEVIM